MSGPLRQSTGRIAFILGVAVAATSLLLTQPSSAQDADQAKDKPAAPPALSPLPVQEGDDPIAIFVPKDPETSELKLQGEALAWFMTAQLHYSRGENDEG